MCELVVGLPAVRVFGILDEVGSPLLIHVETRGKRPACGGCGGGVAIKDRPLVVLVDPPPFRPPPPPAWRQHRSRCPSPPCAVRALTQGPPRTAPARPG